MNSISRRPANAAHAARDPSSGNWFGQLWGAAGSRKGIHHGSPSGIVTRLPMPVIAKAEFGTLKIQALPLRIASAGRSAEPADTHSRCSAQTPRGCGKGYRRGGANGAARDAEIAEGGHTVDAGRSGSRKPDKRSRCYRHDCCRRRGNHTQRFIDDCDFDLWIGRDESRKQQMSRYLRCQADSPPPDARTARWQRRLPTEHWLFLMRQRFW